MGPTKRSARILIADGHEITLNGLLRILEKNSFDVTAVSNNVELVTNLESFPDLLIVDYASVKDFDVDHLGALRLQYVSLPLMIVTSQRDKTTILKILEFNVHGFVFKDCSEEEVDHCVKALLRGERFYCNEVFDMLMESRLAKPGSQWPSHLTNREVDIIKLIVKGNSTSEIARELNLSPHTISTHRKNIIRKLKIKSLAELVAQAYDLGIVSKESA